MLLVAALDDGTGSPPDAGDFFKLFGQIAKNLKGNNLFLFGQGLVLIFGLIFIPIWLHGVLSEGYVILIVVLLFIFILISPLVVVIDIQSKAAKRK